MTMHLLAHLDLAGVELSSTFQVSQVVLKWRGSRVRITLSAKATGGTLKERNLRSPSCNSILTDA